MVEEELIDEKTREFAGGAIRPPMRLSVDDLVATELATATLSEPLSKIRHVAEALMVLSESERRDARITDDEEKEMMKIYKLAIAHQNVFLDKFLTQTGAVIDRSATLQWPFSSEEAGEWDEWIRPSGINLEWYSEDSYHAEFLEKVKKLPESPRKSYLLVHGRKLMPDCVYCLKTHFIIRAMPKTMVMMKRIMGLVSPEMYLQALKSLKGAKHGQ